MEASAVAICFLTAGRRGLNRSFTAIELPLPDAQDGR